MEGFDIGFDKNVKPKSFAARIFLSIAQHIGSFCTNSALNLELRPKSAQVTLEQLAK
ncbi:hypothetical protein HGO34_02705 [Agrobacterium vitis]|uniref:Uncharacterized protein n=1 Tax=Agrobacterium vitis TaxID=373 RepID=A0AAE4W9Z3_AGRVI|nr:hypothetical protein [Agrobacterium vitis]MCM2438629.1 hypothetical protein [Agrobacterium vitis]MUZ56044.1 hypothetical protein [Agrobacterium vitis]MVA64818.1 hypothetical protein [Agrobacterium vitis]MVA85789.1 hypothetical protein [Agrobacterium vitis]